MRWPMELLVRMKHMADVTVGARDCIEAASGTTEVYFRFGAIDDRAMTPAEAKRFARALHEAADRCIAHKIRKRAFARSRQVGKSVRIR